MTEQFLQNNNLKDEDDIDSLIEFAALIRELVNNRQYENINQMINYTLDNSYLEAFSWCMGIMQEEFEKDDCRLDSFECTLGKSIPAYDEFIKRLQVDFNACSTGLEKIYDNHGEVESFFNILVYETGFKNIFLISSENFDTKDNDFIQYKLSFSENGKEPQQ